MTKMHFNNYTVYPCTAIAGCDLEIGEAARQDALYIVADRENGEELFDFVVFDAMPESEKEFSEIAADFGAWESDSKVLATVLFEDGSKPSDYCL